MTNRTSAIEALATASAAMLTDQHPADILSRMVSDCMEPLSAHAAAILVTEATGELGLLSASSHRAAEIEMLQAQHSYGPCVETIASGEPVSAVGVDALVERWDDVGAAIRDAGFVSVHAFPMRWHDLVLGGLNIFRTEDDRESDDTRLLGQAFADVATLVLLRIVDVPAEQISARVHEAVAARSVVEQAKGVLAHLEGLDMERAYDRLLQRSTADGASLTETALRIVREQHT